MKKQVRAAAAWIRGAITGHMHLAFIHGERLVHEESFGRIGARRAIRKAVVDGYSAERALPQRDRVVFLVKEAPRYRRRTPVPCDGHYFPFPEELGIDPDSFPGGGRGNCFSCGESYSPEFAGEVVS